MPQANLCAWCKRVPAKIWLVLSLVLGQLLILAVDGQNYIFERPVTFLIAAAVLFVIGVFIDKRNQ